MITPIKRLIIDGASVAWTALYAGKDEEFGQKVEHNGKTIHVNSAVFGRENAMNMITAAWNRFGIAPIDTIFVREGKNSKSFRQAFDPKYKASPDDSRTPESYEQYNILINDLIEDLCSIGATAVSQDGIEGDDVIAYLAQNLQGERYILTGDGDITRLVAPGIHVWRRDKLDENPYGPFPNEFITVYKALVGDSSDGIKGAPGFGPKSFLDLYCVFGEDGLELMEGLIKDRKLETLVEDVSSLKALQKIIDGQNEVYTSYSLARLWPNQVNTLHNPLQWKPGYVKAKADVRNDDRLRCWAASHRIVHSNNFADALAFFKSKMAESPTVTLDLETSVNEQSEDWLAQRSAKGGGVDVIGSKITGCGLTFGANNQFSYYVTVDHAMDFGTPNVTIDQLGEMLEAVPKDKITLAHNAAGFELPVLANHFRTKWAKNGWRGFYPNMVDTRIASSYYNENVFSHGLKQLSKSLLGYEQVSYDEVTSRSGKVGTLSGGHIIKTWNEPVLVRGIRRGTDEETGESYEVEDMVPQIGEDGKPVTVPMETRSYTMRDLTASHVFAYGIDDVVMTAALWNFFRLHMEMENTLEPFFRLEQKPVYLSALSYIEGTKVDRERLVKLRNADDEAYSRHRYTLDGYLLDKGWAGTVCPAYKELDASSIKEIFEGITGKALDTRVRTPAKLIDLVEQADAAEAPLIAALMRDNNLDMLNELVERKFDNTPEFDVGSPKQVQALLYEVMALPIRLRNKPTDAMRAKGIREGAPKTDEDAMKMALKMGDCDQPEVLKALIELRSIQTRRGLYWEPYPKAIHWKTGRIHPQLKQSSTNTRRWASSEPNIQQLDSAKGGVRTVILPHRYDAVVVSLDESAQEVRLAAAYSKDANLLTCYLGTKEQLRDVHSIVACKIAGCTYDEFRSRLKGDDKEVAAVADRIRSIAKTVLFASFYGAAAPKIAEGLGISVDEAQGYIDTIYAQFPDLAEWKKNVEKFAANKGYVPVWGGTRRHLREPLLGNSYDASKALRQASNASIQSAGANQIKTVMSSIWDSDLLERFDMRWMFPVHDECVFSVVRGDAAAVIKEVHSFMVAQFLDGGVPSASSIGLGRNFGDLVELGEVYDEAKIEAALDKIFAEELEEA